MNHDKKIALLFSWMSIFFLTALMTNSAFFDWAFDRHHNQWSWYIRPLFIVPYCYFAFRRTWAGIAVTLFCLLTSMFWFSKPEFVDESIKNFLQFEKEWLLGNWGVAKVFQMLTVPLSFVALGVAFWKRRLLVGLGVIILIATGKIIWSIQNAGESGRSILGPALLGLLICIGLIFLGFKKMKNSER